MERKSIFTQRAGQELFLVPRALQSKVSCGRTMDCSMKRCAGFNQFVADPPAQS